MIIYITAIILFYLISLNKSNLTERSFYLCSSILLLIAGLRSETVGTDLIRYVSYNNNEVLSQKEYGFQLLNELIRGISENQLFFIFVTSIISLVPVFIIINHRSENKPYSLLLFILLEFFYFYLSGIRQAISISLVLMSVDQYLNNKHKTSFFLYLTSIIIHTSSIYTFPIIIILNKLNVSKKIYLIAIITSLFIGWFDFINIRGIIDSLSSVNYIFISKYSSYSEYMNDLNFNFKGRTLYLLPLTIISILILLKKKDKTINDNLLLKLFICGVIINNIISIIPGLSRSSYYLTMLSIIIIPNEIKTSKNMKIITNILTLCLFIIFIYQTLSKYQYINNDRNDVVPYKFFFE